MNRIYCLILVVLFLSGLGCEGIFTSDDEDTETYSAEEVEKAAFESSEGDSITTDVTLQVGAQIIELNFRKYQDAAYDSLGNFSITRSNKFANNLERLYNDVDRILE